MMGVQKDKHGKGTRSSRGCVWNTACGSLKKEGSWLPVFGSSRANRAALLNKAAFLNKSVLLRKEALWSKAALWNKAALGNEAGF